MRFSPVLLFLFSVAASALAEQPKPQPEPERKGEARLLHWDMKKSFDVRQSSFSPKSTFVPKGAQVKEFGFEQKYAPKSYDAKTYGGSKGAWTGNFKFATNEANTKGKYQIPNASKQADTKTMPVSDARESGKANPVRNYDNQRPYLGKEAERMNKGINPNSQQTVGWSGTLKPMTIDDVRELLNKNK